MPAALRSGAGSTPDGAAWLARLPALVRSAVARWDLRLDQPFVAGSASWCAPGRDGAGRDVVLKVSFPHDEARHEADVLRAWAGHGAVGLVAAHPADWALLLRRVRPGTALRSARTPVTRRLVEGATVLRALAGAPAPGALPTVGEVGRRWAALVAERAARATAAGAGPDPALVRQALAVLDAPDTPDLRTVHGDLNPGNLLRGPDGWVAIDPKALRGDPAYDVWPLVEQVGDPWRTPDPARALADRTALVAGAAALDAGHAAAWAVARSVESALWGWSHTGDARALRRALARSRAWVDARDRLAG